MIWDLTFSIGYFLRNFYEMLAKLVLMYDASKFLSLFLGALVQHS